MKVIGDLNKIPNQADHVTVGKKIVFILKYSISHFDLYVENSISITDDNEIEEELNDEESRDDLR